MNWRQRIARVLIRIGYRILKLDMIGEAYRLVGIDLGVSLDKSSEKNILRRVIFPNLKKDDTVFDIGANIGNYSQALLEYFNSDSVHSFEPNPACIIELKSKLSNEIHPFGLSSINDTVSFYINKNDPLSSHGSLINPKGQSDFSTTEIAVKILRADEFLNSTKTPTPAFVKIDTEGNDLSVIEGLGNYKNKISFIQFEFNEMYVDSRVFLHDFYIELSEFKLYRIGNTGLIDISTYSKHYEIFRYQNILAVNRNLNIELPIEF